MLYLCIVSLNAPNESNYVNAKKFDTAICVGNCSNEDCHLNASVNVRVKHPIFFFCRRLIKPLFFRKTSVNFSGIKSRAIPSNNGPVDTRGRTDVTGENGLRTQLLQKRPEIHLI